MRFSLSGVFRKRVSTPLCPPKILFPPQCHFHLIFLPANILLFLRVIASGATRGRARRRRRARSSSPRCAGGWASSSAVSSHATAPHPPGAVHRRAACRRRAAHAARPAHRRTAGASAALRAVRRLLPVPARPARDGWPAARKRARTPRVPQGGRGARAPQRRSYTAY